VKRRLPIRDEIAAYQREVVAERRVGEGAQCACGESRPRALVEGSSPTICFRCDRKKNGRTTLDEHHVAGKSNSPVTMSVPVNDHRARLSVDQYDWPKETLENPDGSPLLRAAASIRGFVDFLLYLIDKFILWIPEMLEDLDAFLAERFGSNWWKGTPLEKYAPKR